MRLPCVASRTPLPAVIRSPRPTIQDVARHARVSTATVSYVINRNRNVSPALVSYLNTEVAGQLRGMSQQAIFSSWIEAQIDGVMGQLREQCLEEAELRRDAWQ